MTARMRGLLVGWVVCGALLLSLAGCGSQDKLVPVVTGRAAERAVAVVVYQTLIGARQYLVPAMMLTAPKDSGLSVLPAGMVGVAEPMLDPVLALYATVRRVGDNVTVGYTRDVAGNLAAGNASLTLPAGVSSELVYPTYPAAVDLALAVSAGNLPATGQGRLTYRHASGASNLVAQVRWPANDCQVLWDTSLSATHRVSGEVTMRHKGLTITAAELAGPALGPITGRLGVAPFGWTGTLRAAPGAGTVSLELAIGGGKLVATTNSRGALVLDYSNGTHETIARPLLARFNDPPPAR